MATPWASTTPSGSRASLRYPGEDEIYTGDNRLYHESEDDAANFAFIGDHSMMTGGTLPRGAPFTQKIPPSFNGRVNWFEFETRVRGWADICSVETERKAPMLKSALQDLAALCKKNLTENDQKTKREESNTSSTF